MSKGYSYLHTKRDIRRKWLPWNWISMWSHSVLHSCGCVQECVFITFGSTCRYHVVSLDSMWRLQLIYYWIYYWMYHHVPCTTTTIPPPQVRCNIICIIIRIRNIITWAWIWPPWLTPNYNYQKWHNYYWIYYWMYHHHVPPCTTSTV